MVEKALRNMLSIYYILNTLGCYFMKALGHYVLISFLLEYFGIDCTSFTSFTIVNSFCIDSQTILMQFVELFNYSSIDTLYPWLYLLFVISSNILRILINKKHGPTHRYSGDMISFASIFLTNIVFKLKIGNNQFNWKVLISIIFLLISGLIYNEY